MNSLKHKYLILTFQTMCRIRSYTWSCWIKGYVHFNDGEYCNCPRKLAPMCPPHVYESASSSGLVSSALANSFIFSNGKRNLFLIIDLIAVI